MQVRKANVIKDSVELARSFHRYTLDVGTLDPTNNLVDTDLSQQPAEVSTICNAVWTDEVKSLWKAKLIADKSS